MDDRINRMHQQYWNVCNKQVLNKYLSQRICNAFMNRSIFRFSLPAYIMEPHQNSSPGIQEKAPDPEIPP